MNAYRLTAPSGAISLRQMPEFDIERAFVGAVKRLALTSLRRKRRTEYLEETMFPDQQNHLASPAQGSTLNAGQFGSQFAQIPCNGCTQKGQAYDAQVPARPQRSIKQLFTSRTRAHR